MKRGAEVGRSMKIRLCFSLEKHVAVPPIIFTIPQKPPVLQIHHELKARLIMIARDHAAEGLTAAG